MYRFNLEPLLNHRRYQEEILQKELASLETLLATEKQKLKDLKKMQRKYLRQLQQKQKDGRSVSEIKLYLDYIERISNDLDQQNQRVQRAAKGFDVKRQQLIEAMKKRKTLEKLREKGWHAHQQKVLKKERSFMDEVAAQQFRRKR